MPDSNSIPGQAVINHEAGDTLIRTYTVTEGGTLVDFTGATIEFIISIAEDGAAVISTNEAAESDTANGKIKIVLQTTALQPKKTYFYKLRVTFPDGMIKTYMEDKLKTK